MSNHASFSVHIWSDHIREESVVVEGMPVRVGFTAEIDIDLPFPPFVGLVIEIPSKTCPDPVDVKLDRVVWDAKAGSFLCYAEDSVCIYSTIQIMLESAADLEKDGWAVDRDSLCEGKWHTEAKHPGMFSYCALEFTEENEPGDPSTILTHGGHIHMPGGTLQQAIIFAIEKAAPHLKLDEFFASLIVEAAEIGAMTAGPANLPSFFRLVRAAEQHDRACFSPSPSAPNRQRTE